MFQVENDPVRRTIRIRMSGFIRADEMQKFAEAYRAATDTYAGGRHLILADMRGLKPMEPETAAIMREAIGYARQRGVAMCAHLSDSVIARLQAKKLAYEAAPEDDVTVDCVSLEEAEKLLPQYRARLFGTLKHLD